MHCGVAATTVTTQQKTRPLWIPAAGSFCVNFARSFCACVGFPLASLTSSYSSKIYFFEEIGEAKLSVSVWFYFSAVFVCWQVCGCLCDGLVICPGWTPDSVFTMFKALWEQSKVVAIPVPLRMLVGVDDKRILDGRMNLRESYLKFCDTILINGEVKLLLAVIKRLPEPWK